MNMPMNTARRGRLLPFFNDISSDHTGLRIPLRNIRNLLEVGDIENAALAAESLSQQAPYDIRVLAINAECMAAKGEHEAAVLLNDRLLTQQDSDVVWAAKARSLAVLGRHRRASHCFSRATALAGNTRFVMEHVDCLRAAGQLGEAVKVLDLPGALHQADPQRTIVEAKVLTEIGQNHVAFDLLSKLNPTRQTGQTIALARQNMPNAAVFSKFCNQTAFQATLPCVLAEITKDNPTSISKAQIKRLEQIVGDTSEDISNQIHANLALFRIYDNEANSFQALAHLRNFHALSTVSKSHHSRREIQPFIALTHLKFEKLLNSKSEVLPIFVTGLPGSGLQIAADVLAQAANCGTPQPLSLIPAIMSRFMQKLRVQKCTHVSSEDMLALQSDLRAGLQQAANGRDVVIDTSEINFTWSGLIAAALPEARIVHMKRDPMTTGWALHKSGSSNPAYACQHDLRQIQAFQQRSTTLMAHWEAVFSPNVISISSDALSRPGSNTAQAMVSTCQLKWTTQCEVPTYHPDRSWHRYAAYLNPLRHTNNKILNLTCDQSTM